MKQMKRTHRLTRINDEIVKELASMVQLELKDPRLKTMTSIVKADTSQDLKYCKVYISVLGDEQQKKDVLTGLKNAKGFLRKQLAESINLRNTPELSFVLDESLEHSMKIEQLIQEISAKEGGNTGSGT